MTAEPLLPYTTPEADRDTWTRVLLLLVYCRPLNMVLTLYVAVGEYTVEVVVKKPLVTEVKVSDVCAPLGELPVSRQKENCTTAASGVGAHAMGCDSVALLAS